MVRNDSGTGNYSMVTALDTGKIVVQNGASSKVKVKDFILNTWYTIKMAADWNAKTYSVYINDDPVPVARLTLLIFIPILMPILPSRKLMISLLKQREPWRDSYANSGI